MHVELQLLSRIIRTGQLPEVIEYGIQEGDFRTTEGRGLYQHLSGYWRNLETSGAVPGANCFKNLYPGFEFCDDEAMTLDALCTEVRRQHMRVGTRELMTEVNDLLDSDPATALAKLRDGAQQYCSMGMRSHDLRISDAAAAMRSRYERSESGQDVCVLRWPWEPFNDATQGIQDDDYVVFYGRPKSKKTFVMGEFIASAYDQDKLVLAYTKEMPAWQLHRRCVTSIGRFPFDELRLGRLSPELRQEFFYLTEMLEVRSRATHGRHDIIAISGKDAPSGCDSIGWLRGKVEKYKPDVVFIDGLYLMAADSKTRKDEERVKQISRAARQLVLDTHTPIIATMQANRAAAKNADAELDEIAYSDAIGQDATCAIRVINENTSPPTIVLKVAGSREFNLDGIRIGGTPCTDFAFREKLNDRDVARAIKHDTPDGKPANDGKHKPITRNPSNKSEHKKVEEKLMKDQMATVR